MIDFKTVTRLTRVAAMLAAGIAFLATADIAAAKKNNDNNKSNNANYSLISNVKHKDQSTNKDKDAKHDHKDKHKQAKRDRMDKAKNKEKEAKKGNMNPKLPKEIPLTYAYNGLKVAAVTKFGPKDTLVISGARGATTIDIASSVPGHASHTVFGTGEITISSSVAHALRLDDKSGGLANARITDAMNVKQNTDGSVTFTNTGFN